MQYNELVQLYFERSNALQSYWTLYVVVIGGLLAVASMRQRPDLLTTSLVTVLFACFAFKNISAIHDVTLQRFAVLDAINKTAGLANAAEASIRGTLNPTFLPPAYPGVRNFHVVTDLLTIIILWRLKFAAVALQLTTHAQSDPLERVFSIVGGAVCPSAIAWMEAAFLESADRSERRSQFASPSSGRILTLSTRTRYGRSTRLPGRDCIEWIHDDTLECRRARRYACRGKQSGIRNVVQGVLVPHLHLRPQTGL